MGHVRDLARQYTTEAIETLANIMRNSNDALRITAAQVLLERAWGRLGVGLHNSNSSCSRDRRITVFLECHRTRLDASIRGVRDPEDHLGFGSTLVANCRRALI